jgi:hypothetical protein
MRPSQTCTTAQLACSLRSDRFFLLIGLMLGCGVCRKDGFKINDLQPMSATRRVFANCSAEVA